MVSFGTGSRPREQLDVGLAQQEWRYALTVEVLFGLAFVAWVFFKALVTSKPPVVKMDQIPRSSASCAATYFPAAGSGYPASVLVTHYFGYVCLLP
ncbi:MAG: hypothetical protein H6632_13000 [Anaerolineales bacterium]|nr:hypothetical protein [Anaerolineales bacterium]